MHAAFPSAALHPAATTAMKRTTKMLGEQVPLSTCCTTMWSCNAAPAPFNSLNNYRRQGGTPINGGAADSKQ